MKLSIPLHVFLQREQASVRLFNLLLRSYRPGTKVPTLSQFIDQWPLARLRKEVFGFGPKAQAELLELLARQPNAGNRRFMTYVASLRPKVAAAPERTCVYCGCTDSRACPGGCSWVVTWQYGHVGVCSACIAPHQPFQQAIEPMIKSQSRREVPGE